MAAPPTPLHRFLVLGLIASAVPLGLVLESALRRVLLGRDFDAVRDALRPTLAPIAWGLAGLTVLCVVLGFWVRRWLLARGLQGLGARVSDPAARDRVALEALYVATSVPQGPALLATVASMAGAPAHPVLVSAALSTLGVLALGLAHGGEPHS